MSLQSWDCARPATHGAHPDPEHGFIREILNVIPSGVAVVDQQGVIVYANPEWGRVSQGGGVVLPGQEHVGAEVLHASTGNESRGKGHAALACRGIRTVLCGAAGEYVMEYSGEDGGGERWYRLSVRPIVNGSVHVLLVREDITTVRMAKPESPSPAPPGPMVDSEKALREALAEKESLLREVHHRVKNNLQVISSLLSLQMQVVVDQPTRNALLESRNRVRSMALVHEQLYRSGTFSGVDFGAYVRSLTENILRASSVAPGCVTAVVHMENIRLQLDTTIPLGLIVNELVTNATKYAFPGGREGKIVIGMESTGPATFRLTIGDDGVGFPAGVDLTTSGTLGLNLVNTLVSQLDGHIEFGSGSGTSYIISFAERGNATR